eukprot:222380-Pelagomonas_calceolata.AAC.5
MGTRDKESDDYLPSLQDWTCLFNQQQRALNAQFTCTGNTLQDSISAPQSVIDIIIRTERHI